MANILETAQLTKHFRHAWTFRRIRALEGLDLALREGEIFGLIGPNGAGKTTAFKLLLGLLRPSRGTVQFRGAPLDAAARESIGFLPEQPYFYDHLSVEEILTFYARLYGLRGSDRRSRVAEVIEQLQLGPRRRARLRTLSKGNLQRIGIAQAILNRPSLAIMDEPMSGLDPAGRHAIRELIRSLRKQGTTVLFSSHILPDAEALCDRVAVLTAGRLREIVDIRHEGESAAYTLQVSGIGSDVLPGLERASISPLGFDGSCWTLRLATPAAVSASLEAVLRAGGRVESLTPVHASLEERYLAHAGNTSGID